MLPMLSEAHHYAPKERSFIKQLLRGIDPLKNDVALEAFILGPVASWFGGVYPSEIEELLRENVSPYFLVAVPVHQITRDPMLHAYLPQTQRQRYPYVLTICLGEDEVADVTQKFGLNYSAETNRERLKQAGFLMPLPGENKAHQN